MIKTIEFITENDKFHLSLVATNNKLSGALLTSYVDGKQVGEVIDNEEWIFNDLLETLKNDGYSFNFIRDYILDNLGLSGFNREDEEMLIELLEEGKKWLNKPMPTSPVLSGIATESFFQRAVVEGEKRMEELNKSIEKIMFQDSKSTHTARRYNSGKRQWSLLHYPSVEEAIKVLEFGAFKYSIFQEKVTKEKISGKELLEQHGLEIIGSIAMGNYKLISSGRDNWKNGLHMKEMKESAQRHLVAMMNGELRDEESGCLHSAHLMVNAMFINYYELQNQ